MKKLPSITPTDLARIAPLTEDQQRIQLRQYRRGFPPFTYKHTRSVLSELLKIRKRSMFDQQDLSWAEIEAALKASCRQGDEVTYNVMAAKALHDFALANDIYGRDDGEGGFGYMPLGQGHSLVLWENGVVLWEDRPHVLFVDLRGTKYLTVEGRRFAFSAQHEQIRLRDPNMEKVGLLILRVEKPMDGQRRVIPHTDTGIELYSFDELDRMTRQTYRLWEEIYFGRVEEEQRRAAGDGFGPLFDL